MHLEDDLAILTTTRDPRECAELALVLEARALDVVQGRIGRSWVLRVPAAQLDDALAELEQYQRENAWRPGPAGVSLRPGRGWPGAVVYVAIITGMVVPVSRFLFGRDWLRAGRLDGAAVLDGEWWRAITALTLHADAAHLLGNAGFGAFFGYSLARSFGNGFAWLAILMSGFVGNLANAWLAGPDHRAIGASTAVFGALGMLSAYSWRTGFRQYRSFRQRIAPVIAGIGLLAFTGTGGQNTDIGAHLLGFVAGFGLGAGIAAFGAPETRQMQLACAAAAIGLVAGSWLLALGS